MKKSFVCSIICSGGILGGGIYIDDTSITYKTNKLTVDKKYKNLVLPLDQIVDLSWKWIVFPIVERRCSASPNYEQRVSSLCKYPIL